MTIVSDCEHADVWTFRIHAVYSRSRVELGGWGWRRGSSPVLISYVKNVACHLALPYFFSPPCCALRLPTTNTLASFFIRLEISLSYSLAACFASLGGDIAVRLAAFCFCWCFLRHGLLVSQRGGHKHRIVQVHRGIFPPLSPICCLGIHSVEASFLARVVLCVCWERGGLGSSL